MSDNGEQLSQIDDTISSLEDIPGSSISFSIKENNIFVKEKTKIKPVEQPNSLPVEHKKEQWWLKKPTTQLDMSVQKKNLESKKTETTILSPDVSSSTKDFLNKENMCKKEELEKQDNANDTLEDILASVAFDKYQSDFDCATDDDIGSIWEEMSKRTGNISPVLENTKSKSEIVSADDIQQLLQEADKLVYENGNDLLKGVLKTEIIVPDQNSTVSEGLSRVQQLEEGIFKMIEDQANENNIRSEKKNTSPSVASFENINSSNINEYQKKKLDEHKVEVSSNSDLEDPIEIYSGLDSTKNEKKLKDKKHSIKKEIIDVEKDFFDALIRRTKETKGELSPRSLSFDKEDFENFLKLLEQKSESESINLSADSSLKLLVDQFDPLKQKDLDQEKEEFTEKEISHVQSKNTMLNLESSLKQLQSTDVLEERSENDSNKYSSRNSSRKNSARNLKVNKNVVKDQNAHSIDSTPRLKLFADDIPKLIAQKSNMKKDDVEKQEDETTPKSEGSEDFSFKNFKALDKLNKETLNSHKNVTGVRDFIDFKDSQVFDDKNLQNSMYFQNSEIKNSNDKLKTCLTHTSENRNTKNEKVITKSRSYDQLSKSSRKLGSSLENIKNIKTNENRNQPSTVTVKKLPIPKIKTQPKIITRWNPKSKVTSKTTKEPIKPAHPNEYGLNIRGNQIKSCEGVKNSFGGGDWIGGISDEYTLETLYQEEKQKFTYVKLELEAEIETYKSKLKDTQNLYEQEMFLLKKQNILLKAKVDELVHLNKKTPDVKSKYDPKIMSMQKELDRQENLIHGYELENKKLLLENKRLQNELKSINQSKPKINTADIENNNQELVEKIKDLQEENVKINMEVTDLKQKNNDFSLKNEDVTQQNCLLQEELEMIKDQLRAKNDFITDRLQSMTTNELELRKEVEDLKVELNSKVEQLKSTKLDCNKLQENLVTVEREVTDLRAKVTLYQEKLQTAKFNCEREKQLTLKLKDQVLLDNKNIVDLNRQVREMERILKRKNPDSVSALILTANSENEKLSAEKVKLLEDRIVFLENELKIKEEMSRITFMDIQKKFIDMKDKYSTQVSDLELKAQLSERPQLYEVEKKVYADAGTQTMYRILESRGSEPNLNEKSSTARCGPKSHNLKEDTHLIATIRGLKQELANKEKIIAKLNKDIQELQKNVRKLQKEREKLLNDRKNIEKINNRIMTASDSKLMTMKSVEIDELNSNFYQNGHLAETKKMIGSSWESHETNSKIKKLSTENDVLKDELSRMNKELMLMKNKRVHDLSILQDEHEKEIALLIKECNVKIDDTKASKLEGQINSQMSMITHLQQQIEKLQDYKDQVVILKTERDHLEGKNKVLNEKVKYLSTPSSQQLEILQDKIAILQQRHESRELSLQKLIRDLLRSRNQGCTNCKSVDERSRGPCHYREEFDKFLGTLQDITGP